MKKTVPVLVVALPLLTWASDNRLPGGLVGLVSTAAAQEGPPNIEGLFDPPGGPGPALEDWDHPTRKASVHSVLRRYWIEETSHGQATGNQ